MTKIVSFTDLRAWREGHLLVLVVYKTTSKFPEHERFGLVSQMRRSAISITSNLAEGFSRQSYREKVQFYSTALGSLTELQNQLFIAKDVGYVSPEGYQKIASQTVEVHKMTNGLIKSSKSVIRNS